MSNYNLLIIYIYMHIYHTFTFIVFQVTTAKISYPNYLDGLWPFDSLNPLEDLLLHVQYITDEVFDEFKYSCFDKRKKSLKQTFAQLDCE